MPDQSHSRQSRRSFIKKSAALTAGAVGFPYIIPSSALGLNGSVAPSNRTVIGCIGVGSQGTGNMRNFLRKDRAQIVAVCDVDANHRDRAVNLVNERYGDKGCVGTNEFEAIIARDDVDAVSIAVPDHWHAIPAIAAAKSGKDIYAEKPLALTIPEGRAMVDAVERYGSIWQTGSWQRSRDHFRFACELVRNGRIGTVHTVRVGLPTGPTCPAQPEMPVPEGFDYDRWLGPAPEAPYTELRCHWNFRWILDYSGGQLTDWAAHHCDIANWGMGTEHTGPMDAEGFGEFPEDGLYNAATNYYFECRFGPDPSRTVAPDGFRMHVSNRIPMGARFEGTEGWIHVSRGGLTTRPETLKTSMIGATETRLYESHDHFDNFLDCVRTRTQTITPIEPAHRAISIAHLGNIAMRLGRPVQWDPADERFVNDTEANQMLARAYRGTWHV